MRIGTAAALLPFLALLVAADGGDALRPGLWEESTRITGATLAGAPAGMAFPAPQVRRLCVRPDQDVASVLAAADPPGCTADRVRAGAGRVSISGVCQGRSGAAATTEAAGRYAAEAYALDVATTMLRSARPLVVRSHVAAQRIGGDCAGAGRTG